MEVLGDVDKAVQESLITDESDDCFPGEKQKELALRPCILGSLTLTHSCCFSC